MDENRNKNIGILKEQVNSFIESNSKSEKEFRDRRMAVEDQRRDYLKFLIILIVTIIGSSYFLQISHSNELYFSGVILFVLIIVLIILYLRETIDEEGNAMQKLLSNSKLEHNQQISLVFKYMEQGKYTDDDVRNYFKEYSELPQVKRIKEEMKLVDVNSNQSPLEYFGELICFVFLSGLFLILGSVKPDYFNWIFILSGEICILFISCGNTAKFIIGLFSKFADYLVKKMFK